MHYGIHIYRSILCHWHKHTYAQTEILSVYKEAKKRTQTRTSARARKHTQTHIHIPTFKFTHHCLSVLFNLLSFLPHLEKYIC